MLFALCKKNFKIMYLIVNVGLVTSDLVLKAKMM